MNANKKTIEVDVGSLQDLKFFILKLERCIDNSKLGHERYMKQVLTLLDSIITYGECRYDIDQIITK
jgi:hypothetical protein